MAPVQRELNFLGDDADPWHAPCDVLVLAGPADQRPALLAEADRRLGVNVTRGVERKATATKPGSVTVLDVDHERWHQVAVVVVAEDPAQARAAGVALAGEVAGDAVLVTGEGLSDGLLDALLEGWLLASYRFTLSTREAPPAGGLWLPFVEAGFDPALATAAATCTARDLANTPSNMKSPQWLAEQIHLHCTGAGLEVSVMSPTEVRAEGFGGVLAVASGSAREPRVVVVRSAGRSARSPRVVLIGKGVTYDSGGLSLKPADSMALMKTDMAGAAAVTGAMLAYAADPGVNADAEVIALLPLVENMPSGTAYRPGDVIRHYGGLTTEVSNTDAEGRLLLADMLAYAQDRLQPSATIDLATLTGAATLGLSRHFAALFSSEDALARQLVHAGEQSGDLLWRMPLVADYRRHLAAPIADIAQTATDPGVRAGSIMAALYLQRFAGEMTWAHIDMAGPARADKPRGEHPIGATGFGVRLLAAWLRSADLAAVSPRTRG